MSWLRRFLGGNKPPPIDLDTPDGLRDALMAAVDRRDGQGLVALCREHQERIVEWVPRWRTVPEALRQDPEQVRRWGAFLPALAPRCVVPLLDWLEARGRAGGARMARVSLMKAPGVGGVLADHGYRLTERFLRMELVQAREQPGPLPDGLRLTTLEQVGVPAYLTLSNASFDGVPGALPLSEDDFGAISSGPGFRDDLVAVVVDGEHPAAFCCCMLNEGVGEVDAVGVGVPWRGRGLGRWLLRWAAARLEAVGADKAQLYVAESNEPARELYLSEGFAVVEERESWERGL